ncbi:hypothetical protein P280DRAFT_471142 [Massarina eburnea CBS 473.64]|uniref:Uncharacterized protein n=1 Tax=Massarina eburnea CBS 473.64 TaxID=1395130 RepID=A0A6A6RUY5_9PLEO|nr:hypothetical protein P280DRAFT_471142 [Massarina eburnea CBS 473.64]
MTSEASAQHQNLMHLEERLLNDSHNFGFLLCKIPRDTFAVVRPTKASAHRNVILNSKYYTTHHASPVFAYLDEHNELHMATAWENPASICPFTTQPNQKTPGYLAIPSDELVRAFHEVPPLSWIVHGELALDPAIGSPMLHALLKYCLLNWAIANNVIGEMPQPDYQDLSQIFQLLKKTQWFEQMRVVREETEFLIVQKPVYGPGGIQNPAVSVNKDDSQKALVTEAGSENVKMTDAPALVDEVERNSGTGSTKPISMLSNSISSPPHSDNVHDNARQHQCAALRPNSNTEITDGILAMTDDLQMHETRIQDARQPPYPTPEASGSDEATSETDPILTALRNHEQLGQLLSLLPELRTMVFDQVKNAPPGYLPLRMLIGQYAPSEEHELSGHKAWIFMKEHESKDKPGARAAAPRTYIHIFHPHTDKPVREKDVKFSDCFHLLELVPVFKHIRDNSKGEMLFKAIVKYYYILAANARLFGFKDHLIPINNTFREELRIVCTQMQKFGRVGEDADSDEQPMPPRKRRKGQSASRPPSVSDSEVPALTLSDMSRGTRRTSRRFQEVVPENVSDSSGFSTPFSFLVPEYLNDFRSVQPRKLALGTPVFKNSAKVTDTVNNFLNTAADPYSSDGDSGDEIPAEIPSDVQALLTERHQNIVMLAGTRENMKALQERKDSIKYSMRYTKGNLKRGIAEEGDVAAELKFQEKRMEILQVRIKTHEDAIKGFKGQKNQVDARVAELEKGVKYVEVWDAYQREERGNKRVRARRTGI